MLIGGLTKVIESGECKLEFWNSQTAKIVKDGVKPTARVDVRPTVREDVRSMATVKETDNHAAIHAVSKNVTITLLQ
jgi:hypothetical protein